MKRTIKTLAFSILAVSGMFFVSCQSELVNEQLENGKAVIYGTARINLDLTNDTSGVVFEKVPAGTTIYAKINTEDLVQFPSSSTNYGDLYYTATVDDQGKFTFTIDANAKNVTVSFSSDDFETNQIQGDESEELKVFTLPNGYTEVVHDGVIRITEVIFSEK